MSAEDPTDILRDLKEERDQAVRVSDRRALQGGEAASAKALW